MTQQEIVQAFQQNINAMLQEFEQSTGYRPQQTAALSPALKAVLQTAGAPVDGWQIDIGWAFTPISKEKPKEG